MKKYLCLLAIVMLVFTVAACSNGNKKKASSDKVLESLNLHMLATHENAEIDEYYTELYESMKHTIKKNPKMGQHGAFTVQPYRIFENNQGPFYVFLGINRESEALKNISFNLTVGDEAGHFIWNDETIFLSEDETGVVPSNSALPILVPVTKETMKKTKKVDFNQLDVDISGLYYDVEKNN